VATRGVKIDPPDVLRFQEQNADIGIIVDHPPANYTYGINFPRSHFLECLKRTRENAEFAFRNRTSDKLTLLNVIQGRNADEAKIWYSGIKDVPLDGYGISFEPPSSSEALLRLLLLVIVEHIEGHIHVFNGTGRGTMPILVWASKYIKNMTFDSASWTHLGSYKKFILPNTLEALSVKEQIQGEIPPCWCPVCQKVTLTAYREPNDFSRKLLALHNLYQYVNYFKILVGLRDSYDTYVNFANRVAGRDVGKYIEIFEKGVEESDYNIGIEKQHSISNFFDRREV